MPHSFCFASLPRGDTVALFARLCIARRPPAQSSRCCARGGSAPARVSARRAGTESTQGKTHTMKIVLYKNGQVCKKRSSLHTGAFQKFSSLLSPPTLRAGGREKFTRAAPHRGGGAGKNAQAHKKTPDAGASGVLGSVLRAAGCRPQREREY